ncbi:MAG TPA: alcohol dehydrogenase [Prolixibacteraceae bacterium]|nr:alcohol dehydrogenase [Prolixibacteraceae bacterium]
MAIAFESAVPTRIIFGCGSLGKVPELVAKSGKRALIVTGASRRNAVELAEKLTQTGISSQIFSVSGEPTTTDIKSAVSLVLQNNCDVIVGLGGGSAIDAAKATAALATNPGDITDYLEVIGKGKALLAEPLPFIAVPTTAGTGTEVTKNAVIKSEKFNVKVSLRSDRMYPQYAVIDPLLTIGLPPEITAYTGIDALTHLLEVYVSAKSNPFIDMICRDGLQRIAVSLETAFTNGSNIEARENMAFAAMLGGIALANGKLGAVHGFAGPLGGMYPAPHGAVCACLLPAVMEINIAALRRTNQSEVLTKYNQVAKWLTGNTNACAEDGVVWLHDLVKKLKVPALSSFGVQSANFPGLVEKAKNASSMKGNPVILTDEQLFQVLEKSM